MQVAVEMQSERSCGSREEDLRSLRLRLQRHQVEWAAESNCQTHKRVSAFKVETDALRDILPHVKRLKLYAVEKSLEIICDSK